MSEIVLNQTLDGRVDIAEVPSDSSSDSSRSYSPPSLTRSSSSESTALSTISSATSASSKDPKDTSSYRNPHLPPDFASRNLNKPDEPILYLPPLLSSLPLSHPPYSVPNSIPEQGPLTTIARLPSIDPASLALHKALHHFHPLDAEYASQAYAEAFNWDALNLPAELEREWYCVCFRSKRKAGSDSGPLYAADQKAHEEAVTNGGLIMYWYGTPHPTSGVNLATCIWQSRAHAVAANSRPHHITAMRLAAASYEMYDLERYTLRKVAGETGVRVENYSGGEVSWGGR